jgi:hypothetical protein
MFINNLTYQDLVDEVKSEVDIALEIPNEIYFRWLDALTSLLYTEVIKEQTICVIEPAPQSPFLPMVEDDWGDKYEVSFEDVIAVYADDVQLIKSTPTSGIIFPNTFYKHSYANPNDSSASYSTVGYNTEFTPQKLTLVCINKNWGVGDGNCFVMLPNEFIDLAKSKLRGEAYKLANEDELAAKWLNDYNVLLENFKAWIAEKSPDFGL